VPSFVPHLNNLSVTIGVGSGGEVAGVVILTGEADGKPVPEALVAVAEQL
jgi:hypothetical protein